MAELLILRHAETEATRPGSTDHERRLTDIGRRQATQLGAHLRSAAVPVDRVLCSSALRAQQTLAALQLDGDVDVDITQDLYDAGGEGILSMVRATSPEVRGVLVVGHAPALPWLVWEITDPSRSDLTAMTLAERRFPPCTLARFAVDTPWHALDASTLVDLRLPLE